MKYYKTLSCYPKVRIPELGEVGPTHETDDMNQIELIEGSWAFKRKWIHECSPDDAKVRAATPSEERIDPLGKQSFDMNELQELKMPKLHKIAKDMGFRSTGLNKKLLIKSILHGRRIEP